MKAHRPKTLIRPLILVGVLALSFAPLYMYLSHDVGALKEKWPHRIEKAEPAKFKIRDGRPKDWVRLKEISEHSKWAIVLSEDWAFYQHAGLDMEQIKVAIGEMWEDKRLRGASTITQQMVKNVFLSEERALWRKLHEMILAQKVEKVLSKDRILEVYLNVIEFGPSVYGIRQASYHYFKKHPSELGPREGAFLAMLLPSPKRYSVSFQNKKLSKFAKDRLDVILEKMRMGKVISRETYLTERGKAFSWEESDHSD